MLEDFRLRVFMTLAKEGSFTRTAAALGVSQPAVSQNIADLEKAAGTRLFDRLRGEVVLTPQGKVFMEYAQRLMTVCDQTGNLFAPFQRSSVRIAASEDVYAYHLAPALETFIAVHPEISFERALFEDADLVMTLVPSSDSPFEIPAESISRLRVSMSEPPKTGSYKATRERTMYFDLLYQPSAGFACTRLCRVLKDYLTSF
jgi:DNA-binding transcriptional LysR family regulator